MPRDSATKRFQNLEGAPLAGRVQSSETASPQRPRIFRLGSLPWLPISLHEGFTRFLTGGTVAGVYAGRPIIGIAGGIGSGKSFVASLFAELGCLVIDSDAQVRTAYADPAVGETLRQWWGDWVYAADGRIDRRAIAAKVFAEPAERLRLEALIHPRVASARDQAMRSAVAGGDPAKGPAAFVWDAPLLFETGLNARCDAVVFVDAPLAARLARVRRRGWDAAELARREKLQSPLDIKRRLSDDVVTNPTDADDGASGIEHVRGQVRQVLSRIFARTTRRPRLQ